jgi:hypothetical protein
MSSTLKSAVAGWLVLMLPGTALINATPQGFMEGHLKIVSLRAVEPSDDMPRPAVVGPQTYAQYLLIILSQDETKEIARVSADQSGNYRAALPPGAYILAAQDRATKRVRGKRQPFTVVSNQTVRVDMNIFTGFGISR